MTKNETKKEYNQQGVNILILFFFIIQFLVNLALFGLILLIIFGGVIQ